MIESLVIQNACNGKLAELFDEGMYRIRADLAARPHEDGKRTITLTLDITPTESGQLNQTAGMKVSLPLQKRSGLARVNPLTGDLEDVNLEKTETADMFDKEGNPIVKTNEGK